MGRGKRDQQKREKARATGGSPYRLIGAAGDVVCCFVNKGWREEGMAGIHMLKRAPGHGHASVSFLVDIWCCGLKDAWARLDISYDEFMETIHDRTEQMMELAPMPVEEVRRLVAGSVRFAEQNGFRLPHHWERYAAMIGGIGDWRTADLADFGYKGDIHYVGTESDLARRLTRGTIEDFLDREDVFVSWLDEEDSLYDDEEEMLGQTQEALIDTMCEKARKWCFANRQEPSPFLHEACELMVMSAAQAPIDDFDDESDDEVDAPTAGPRLILPGGRDVAPEPAPSPASFESAQAVGRNLDIALGLQNPTDRTGILLAMEQIRSMMMEDPNSGGLIESEEFQSRIAGIEETGEEKPRNAGKKSSRRRRRRK